MPIEMTFTSWATGGRIMSSTWVGRPGHAEHPRDRVAVDVGVDEPDREPALAIAAARLTVTDDLPTPPLPDATA